MQSDHFRPLTRVAQLCDVMQNKYKDRQDRESRVHPIADPGWLSQPGSLQTKRFVGIDPGSTALITACVLGDQKADKNTFR